MRLIATQSYTLGDVVVFLRLVDLFAEYEGENARPASRGDGDSGREDDGREESYEGDGESHRDEAKS